jgi:ribosomal protein S18 acetylase RimI-like enzyme
MADTFDVFHMCRSHVTGRVTLKDKRDFLDWRECGHGVVEITDIQVGSERGVGRGRALVDGLVQVLHKNLPTVKRVYAVTRESNRIAREFYRCVGFSCKGTLSNFYPDEGADANAVVFVYNV